MKRTILAVVLAASPVVALGAAYEITIDQRNAANTAWVQRIPINPAGTNHGLFWIDGNTKLLRWVTPVGMAYDQANATLTATGVQSDWALSSGPGSILNKPTLSAVATSGAYNDLSGRPVLSAVATSGLYTDLTGRPSFAAVATSGDYNDLSNKPAIPAAQVNSDWSSSSGLSQILNKPSLAAVATSGSYSDLSGRPSLATVATTGAYSDLSGLPSLFDGTWGSLSGKPAWTGTFTGAYSSLTGIPSAFAPSAHTHAAADIVYGTLADARIPSLAISKTTGLQAALDAKFPTPAGTTGQYVRGDGSLATLPTATPYAIGAPSTKSMTLGTGVQCADNTKPCVITITLQAQSSISLSGAVNNEGQVVLGPTSAVGSGTGTVIGFYRNNLGGTLVVGLNLNSAQANSYTVMVPVGYWVAARQSAGSGLTIVSAFEQVTQ